MALLDRLKKATGNIPPMEDSQAPSYEPEPETEMSVIDKIRQMRSQGFNNNQIIQALQRDGYDSAQILESMNQENMQGAGPVAQRGMQMPPSQEDYPQGMPPPPPGMPPQEEAPGERERIEELAEVIIDEKWEELIKSLNKITEWKDAVESRLTKIEQQFTDLKSDFDNLHKAIIGKIGEYDQNILNVGTEIKAMEKVFQKILPSFTENVAELSRITKRVSPSKKK